MTADTGNFAKQAVRGDPMTGDRYYSREFAERERKHMWSRIWHVGGRLKELEVPGDYIVHDIGHDSVIVVKQDDGSIKAFHNTCGHRGQRLVWENSSAPQFTCPYHGWKWGTDGVLQFAPDADDFPQGNPCGKLRLRSVRCDIWGGFVWFNMSDEAPSLQHYLDPIPDLYANFPMDDLVRVFWMRIELDTNWKFATENFVESYHTRTVHPQVPAFCDQDHWNARIEYFANGHGRTVQPMRPSLRDNPFKDGTHPFDEVLRKWEIDPAIYPDFETKVSDGWKALQRQKAELGPKRGHRHYAKLTTEELTSSLHTVIFPNVTLTFNPDDVYFMRTEPHPDDPNKCFFDFWCMAFPREGATHTESPMAGDAPLPLVEATLLMRKFDRGAGVPELGNGVIMQDLMLGEGQQRGVKSSGYHDAYLANQEVRVRLFNEVLNDYLERRR